MRLLDRITLALAAEEGVSDPVTPQIIQAEGTLGQSYDAAKFALQGTNESAEAIQQIVGEMRMFVRDLGTLAGLPPDSQRALEQNDDGFVVSRIQDIVGDLSECEKAIREAHAKLHEAMTAAQRYRDDIVRAINPA